MSICFETIDCSCHPRCAMLEAIFLLWIREFHLEAYQASSQANLVHVRGCLWHVVRDYNTEASSTLLVLTLGCPGKFLKELGELISLLTKVYAFFARKLLG